MMGQHYDILELGLDDSFHEPLGSPLPEIPSTRTLTPWPPSLPRELAMGGDSPENILERCGVKETDYIRWATMPSFRKALSDAAAEVREHGASWRVLCQGIAMDFLPTLDQKLHDTTVPLALKLDALKQIVRWAGLEPKEDKAAGTTANAINIQINLA